MTLKREISTAGILFVSVSAIIGSGWLFGSLYAAQMAGPAAILSWILGGFAIIIIAFCFAELACLFPIAGGIGIFPLFTHGTMVSFVISWVSWLAFIVIAPIEIQAIIQYSANNFPSLVVNINHIQHLTALGYCVAGALLLFLTLINSIHIKFMSLTNTILTAWKIAIPVMVIIFFLSKNFNFENLTEFGGFAPQGAHGVFQSLAVGGIILAFNGFQPGVALAGETKNPKKNIPIAIIGSLIICIIIYCMLQFSFLTAVPKEFLSQGWHNLSFSQEAGPLAGLSIVLGGAWLAKLLYIDASVSPMGSAIVFFAAAARNSFSMSKNEFLPKFFQKTSRSGIPIFGILFNFIISIIIFISFSGWQEMAAFYAAAICLCNSFIPLSLIVLRKQENESYLEHSFKIPYYKIFSFIAFYISNMMLYWCGWNMIYKLDIVISLGLSVFILNRFIQKQNIFPNFKPFLTLLFFIVSISICSKLGSYGEGLGFITIRTEFQILFIISALIYYFSQKVSLNSAQTFEKIQTYQNC